MDACVRVCTRVDACVSPPPQCTCQTHAQAQDCITSVVADARTGDETTVGCIKTAFMYRPSVAAISSVINSYGYA